MGEGAGPLSRAVSAPLGDGISSHLPGLSRFRAGNPPRMRRPPRSSPRAGLTLLEVLAATVIIGVGLVGVGSIVTYGVLSHRKAVEYTIASARATREIERVREAEYLGAEAEASLFPAPDYTIISSSQVSFGVDELKDGVGYITISEDPEAQAINPSTGQPYGNMKQVVVQIFWDRPGSHTGSYSTATLISNRP